MTAQWKVGHGNRRINSKCYGLSGAKDKVLLPGLPLLYVRINYWIWLNYVFLHFIIMWKLFHHIWHTMMCKEKYLNATGQVMIWCGGLTMSWCPKFTAGVQARCARWEVGVITSPWGLNSKIISFHLQMRRRSKPDQIEERRSVSSVWAGKSTHGSGTTHCRRVEMRFECLFLLVQVCLLAILVIFSHSHGWWQHAVLMMSYVRKHLALPYTQKNRTF